LTGRLRQSSLYTRILKRRLEYAMKIDLERLAAAAWRQRDAAFTLGGVKVGAALESSTGEVFTGCNIETQYRTHDVHAEIAAIVKTVTSNQTKIKAMVIVAEKHKFTPCGTCLDWIFQFGGPGSIVAYQNKRGGRIVKYTASELMPHYPNKQRRPKPRTRN